MKNENFLAGWLDGKISDEELRKLVSPADFVAYQQLKTAMSIYQIEDPSMEENYLAIKRKFADTRKAARKTRPLFYYVAAAAVIVVFIGLFQLFSYSRSVATGSGESLTHKLADHSEVTINASSRIEYPNLFRYNRSVKLEGEAFFEVVKGSTFTVSTSSGKIRVLGTKFNVVSREGWFEVTCFDGSVEVTSGAMIDSLQKGESVRIISGKIERLEVQTSNPSWIGGERRYESLPLHFVLGELERQYNQEISIPEKFRNIRFTGTLTNTSLGIALESLCTPLNLRYHETGTGEIIITE